MGADDVPSKTVLDDGWLSELEDDVGRGPLLEVLRDYLDNSAERLAELERGRREADLRLITRAAHDLKSTSAAFGLCALAALAEAIENAGRAGEAKRAMVLLDGVPACRTQGVEALKRRCPEL